MNENDFIITAVIYPFEINRMRLHKDSSQPHLRLQSNRTSKSKDYPKINRNVIHYSQVQSHRQLQQTTATNLNTEQSKRQATIGKLQHTRSSRSGLKIIENNNYLTNKYRKQDQLKANEAEVDLSNSGATHHITDNKQWVAKGNKLYTFCGQASSARKAREKQNKQARVGQMQKTFIEKICPESKHHQQSVSSVSASNQQAAVIVKQHELKLFTQKFAREKLEAEERISFLQANLDELNRRMAELTVERDDLYQCLKFQEDKNEELVRQCGGLNQKIVQLEQCFKQEFLRLEQSYEREQQQNESLRLQILQKQLQLEQQAKLLKQVPSINVLQSWSESDQSRMMSHQISRIKDSDVRGFNQELILAKIENQHLSNALSLQKQCVRDLKIEVKELKAYIKQAFKQHKDKKQDDPEAYECQDSNMLERMRALEQKVNQLMVEKEDSEFKKQTLERSLKVSSDMIYNLQKRNSELMDKSEGIEEDDVKKIVMMMMGEQLRLEESIQRGSARSSLSSR